MNYFYLKFFFVVVVVGWRSEELMEFIWHPQYDMIILATIQRSHEIQISVSFQRLSPMERTNSMCFFSFCPLLFSFHRAALRNDEVTIIISRTGWCGRAFLPLLTFHFYSSFFSFLFRYVWGKHLFHLCLHFSPTRLWKRVVVIFHCFFAFAAGRCLLRASHHCVDVPAWNWVWFSWAFKHFSLWFDACRCAHSFPFLKDIVGLWLFSWHFRCCCCFFVFFLYLHLNVSVLFCAFPMVTWAQLLICEQLCTNSAQICFSV